MNTDNRQSVFIPDPAKPESVFIRVTLRSLSRTGLCYENVRLIALIWHRHASLWISI